MEQTPKKIYKDFQNKNLDRYSAVEILISIIDNSDNEDERIECVENLKKIGVKSNKVFKFLENLLVSDSNERIRNAAIKVVKEIFINEALAPMKWAIKYEFDYYCFINIIETLVKLNNPEPKSILINYIQKIMKKKYLDKDKRIDNKKFKKSLKNLIKSKKLEYFTHKELAEIIINYKTISELTKKFYSVYFELKNALVIKLDLADVEYEVRGWKADYKNNIKEISEITGLKYLKHLSHLNISNNQIRNIRDLIHLKNLTHLYMSNNFIQNIENLEYIKKMSNLKYLDIAGNRITDKLIPQDFENLEVNLKKPYF